MYENIKKICIFCTKSAKLDRGKLLAKNEYIKKYNPKYSIRISSKNFGFEHNIKSVPLYAVFCINNLK